MSQKLVLVRIVFLSGLLTTFVPSAAAGDWPQILGPSRNGKAAEEKLAESWPVAGPKVVWKHRVGSGYAGPAVQQNSLVVFHRVDSSERVECLDATSGKLKWQSDFAANYRGGVNEDLGPRCVPLISGSIVYVYGAAGDLHAMALNSGKKLWSRALYADYRGDEGYFGAGTTPIQIGGRLLINVGGRDAGLVALDPGNGKTIWKSTREAASYASPTAALVDGQEQAIFVTRMNCLLVSPASGEATTLFPFGQRGPTVNAATPLVFGGKLFTSASYGVGAVLASLDGRSAKTVWKNDDTLSSQYATPVEHDGFLYGIHGREDIGVAELRCVEVATGKVRWKQEGFGVAHAILADGKLLLQGAGGRIALAAADPAKYRELASAQVSREAMRALPALSNGRLYVRTGVGGGELLCLQVGR